MNYQPSNKNQNQIYNVRFEYPEFLQGPLFSKAKFVCIKAGRRSGKTYNTAQWICDKLLEKKSCGLWVDTTQSNISKYVERYFRTILKPIWPLMQWNAQKYILTFPNGSFIDFGSAERPELLEGFEYDYGVLNEGGIILKNPALWNNSLQPMFKGKDTQVRIIGTPKGKNKFHDLYALGIDSLQLNWESYSFTAYESPYWDAEELDQYKLITPEEVWRQEFLAEFLEGAGSVFRNIYNCTIDEQYDQPKEGFSYVISADLAKHQDFTVLYIAEEETKKVIYQERFNGLDWVLQKMRIVSLYNRFGCNSLIMDSTGVGDAIYDDLLNQELSIVPYVFTNSSKATLIRNLSVAMDNNEIKFAKFPELLQELEIFGFEVSKDGKFRYSAPPGLHDDCVISLALVNHLLLNDNTLNMDLLYV